MKINANKSLLVFEDDKESAELVRHIFEKAGYTVNIAYHVDQYFHCIAKYQPHVILLDLRIPSLGGEIVCRNIKARFDLPVVMYSADHNLEEIAKVANADAFIRKPYRISELVGIIERQYTKIVDGQEQESRKSPRGEV